MKKRAALYARVSTDRQAKEGDSIQAQLSALKEYCEKNNYDVAGIYIDDGVSGTLLNERDELQHLLEDVRQKKIDILLFTKLDRYFRNLKHYLNTQEVLDKFNVPWRAIWEHYETQTPQGRLMVSQMLSFAQFEAEQTGQRINQVFNYKRQKKEVLSGKTPYGYMIKDKHIVPDPEKADIAKRLFTEYIRIGSVGELVRKFEAYGTPKSMRGMKHLLKNEKYIGKANGYDDYCEPLIDEQTFETVQRMLSMNIKSNRIYDYIFSGLCVCKECRMKMCGTYNRYKNTYYFSYICPQHHKPTHPCTNSKNLSEKKLEKYLVKNLENLAFSEIDEKNMAKTYDIEKQIESLQKKLTRLKDLYINELITLDEYRTDMTAYNSRIDDLKKQQKNYECPDKTALKELIGMNLDEWYWTLTRKERQKIWRRVIKRIEFGQDGSIDVYFA